MIFNFIDPEKDKESLLSKLGEEAYDEFFKTPRAITYKEQNGYSREDEVWQINDEPKQSLFKRIINKRELLNLINKLISRFKGQRSD